MGPRRSSTNRIIAGVAGGLGARYGVEPILIRVLLAVAVAFGGLGLLVYLVLWVLLPRDDDEVSPLESLFGRGRSSTSPGWSVVLTIVAVLVGVGVLSGWHGLVAAAVIVVLLLIVLLSRRSRHPGIPPGGNGPPGGGPTGAPPEGPSPGPAPGGPHPDGPAVPVPGPSAGPGAEAGARPAGPGYGPAAGAGYGPAAGPPTPGQPLAPHGPWASSVGYPGPAWSDRFAAAFGPLGTGTAAPAGAWASDPWEPGGGTAVLQRESPAVAAPPASPPEPGRFLLLGVWFGLVLIGEAALLAADIAGASVAGPWYPALALALTVIGLAVGTVAGRGRQLILWGVVATLALGVTAGVSGLRHAPWWQDHPGFHGRMVNYQPASAAQLKPDYTLRTGELRLDLHHLSIPTKDVRLRTHVGTGTTEIYVDDSVNVTVHGRVDLGSMRLFDSQSGGVSLTRTVTDRGDDGARGGNLTIDSSVDTGRLEIHRAHS